MKVSSILLLLALLSLSLACTEIPPQINPIFGQGDCPPVAESNITKQQRTVLVEEFNGVRCANCPAGTAALTDLANQYGEQVILVSIHTGFFANPYADSQYDFQTPEGDGLLNLLGAPLGFPSAVINRRLFDGENDLQLGLADWAGYLAQEVKRAPVIKIWLQSNYNPATRELTAEASLFPQADLTGEDIRLSLMLTEDNVTDVQLTPNGKNTNYQHNHVLRDMLTNFDGNLLQQGLNAGDQTCKSYQTTLDPAWKAPDCHLIAFIHRGGAQKEVLQAVKINIAK